MWIRKLSRKNVEFKKILLLHNIVSCNIYSTVNEFSFFNTIECTLRIYVIIVKMLIIVK